MFGFKKKKEEKKKAKFQGGYLLLALLLIVVGVLLIYYNDVPEKMALVIGILLVLYASYRLVSAIADKERGTKFAIRLVVAFAVLVGGVSVIVFRGGVADLLLSLIALMMIIDGSFKLQLTARLKAYGSPLYWVMLVLATGVIAAAFLSLKFPPSSVNNTVFVGLILILDGLSNLFSPFGISACQKALNLLTD